MAPTTSIIDKTEKNPSAANTSRPVMRLRNSESRPETFRYERSRRDDASRAIERTERGTERRNERTERSTHGENSIVSRFDKAAIRDGDSTGTSTYHGSRLGTDFSKKRAEHKGRLDAIREEDGHDSKSRARSSRHDTINSGAMVPFAGKSTTTRDTSKNSKGDSTTTPRSFFDGAMQSQDTSKHSKGDSTTTSRSFFDGAMQPRPRGESTYRGGDGTVATQRVERGGGERTRRERDPSTAVTREDAVPKYERAELTEIEMVTRGGTKYRITTLEVERRC